jgi:hypothetical protein
MNLGTFCLDAGRADGVDAIHHDNGSTDIAGDLSF